MFSCYFLRIIRQSIQVLCPVFSRKVFFRGVEGSNKVWISKTSAECESPRFCRTWRPSDFCSQTTRNTACTARGNEKIMPHVYVIVSRIYGRLFLYLMNSKSDATYTRTYLLMRKQCLMFMLLLAASERAEKNPLKIKFRQDIVESYKPIVWAEPRPISMLQNVSHLSNNHLFLPRMLLYVLSVYT